MQLMRSWLVGMPGENVSCAGCHESQHNVTPTGRTIAMGKRPVEIEPFGGPERAFSFNGEIQPILDRYGAKILLYGLTKMIYMGDCLQEFCGLIAYPSLSELRSLSHDPEFTDIRALRDDSTKNYVLTAIEDFESLNDAIALLERRAQNGHTPPPSSSK